MKKSTLILLTCLVGLMSCQEEEERADAYGNFEAKATTISAETAGKLLELKAAEGMLIEAGEFVAQLDTVPLHLQKLKIQAAIKTLPQKLRTAIADVEVLRERRANLIRERDRVARLVDRKAATPKQLDDMNGEVEVVDLQIDAIETQTETANASVLSEKGPLMAEMELVNDQIRRSRIFNPIRGRVLTKMAEPFEMMGSGTPLYRIADLDTLTFKFYVDAVQLQGLSLGQTIEVLIDSGKEDYESVPGRISWISEESEFTPRTIQTKKDRVNLVYAVEARVSNSNGKLKIGMPGEVKFN